MEFVPTPINQPSFIRKTPYYWQPDRVSEDIFHLYQGDQKEASLSLQHVDKKPPYIQLYNEIYELHDQSSFFEACLLLLKKKKGICAGRIEKKASNPIEGTIILQRAVFKWKFNIRPDTCLLLMDEQGNRLFSYHYSHDHVRLLVNKAGKENEQLIPLLCIGLYLLPIWKFTQPYQDKESKQVIRN